MLRFRILATFTLLTLCSNSYAVIYGEALAGEPIIIVGDRDYAPIEWLDNGRERGIFSSFLPELAQALNRPIDYRLMDWQAAQAMVKNGDADVLTVFSPNPAREASYQFVDSFLKFEMSLFVRQSNIAIRSVNDLSGYRVGVPKGSFLLPIISSQREVRISEFEDHGVALQQLQLGQIDAIATTKWVGAYAMQESGVTGISVVEPPILTKGTHLGLAKSNSALASQLRVAIAAMTESGVVEQVMDKWDSEQVVVFTRSSLTRQRYQSALLTVIIGALIGFTTYVLMNRRHASIKRALKHQQESMTNSDKVATRSLSLIHNLAALHEEQLLELSTLLKSNISDSEHLLAKQIDWTNWLARLFSDDIVHQLVLREWLETQLPLTDEHCIIDIDCPEQTIVQVPVPFLAAIEYFAKRLIASDRHRLSLHILVVSRVDTLMISFRDNGDKLNLKDLFSEQYIQSIQIALNKVGASLKVTYANGNLVTLTLE